MAQIAGNDRYSDDPMMLDSLDQQLTDWQQRLDCVSQNLIDLHGNSTYQRLVGGVGHPLAPLSGVTQQRVSLALTSLTDLFSHFDRLTQTIQRAIALRKQMPRWLGNDDHLREIDQLLNGPSILLPVVKIPLAQRSLVSASETVDRLTPHELLTVMIDAFDTARDVVLAVERAWTQSDAKLLAIGADLRVLQQKAVAAEIALPDLAEVTTELALIQHHLEADPLGANDRWEQSLQPTIAALHARVDGILQQRTQVRDRLRQAETQLAHLHQRYQEAQRVATEFQEKVQNPAVQLPTFDAGILTTLEQWLERLARKAREGSLDAVQIGLTNWTAQVTAAIATLDTTIHLSQTQLQTRQELRGRLEALKAKALAKGQVEDPKLSNLAVQAKQLLYSRPTPLLTAIELVTAYEKHLNARDP